MSGWYPRAIRREIPAPPNDPTIKPRLCIFHVDAGNANSLYDLFTRNQKSSGIESHLFVRKNGEVEQYRSIYTQADANYKANDFAVSVETQGYGDGEWTPEQIESLKDISLWLNSEAHIPLIKATAWNGEGFGYHIQFGSPGYWTPVAKSCPGPLRIKQYNNILLPWMNSLKIFTRRVPTRNVHHLTTPGYRAGNSYRGNADAQKRGFKWIDRDCLLSKDNVPINTHWPKSDVEGFGVGRFDSLSYSTISRLKTKDGYRVRSMREILIDAHYRNLNVEIEAKVNIKPDTWNYLAKICEDLWGDSWNKHVNVKCLTTFNFWGSTLHAAHSAGFLTIALCRNTWRTRVVNLPWVTYTRGNIRSPK